MQVIPHIREAIESDVLEIQEALIGYLNLAVTSDGQVAPSHEDCCNCPYNFMLCPKSQPRKCSESTAPGQDQTCSEGEEENEVFHEIEPETGASTALAGM